MSATAQHGEGDNEAGGRSYTAPEWRLRALSPLDGRYGPQMEPYAAAFCEEALIRERFAVEVAWLLHLSDRPGLAELGPVPGAERWVLEGCAGPSVPPTPPP